MVNPAEHPRPINEIVPLSPEEEEARNIARKEFHTIAERLLNDSTKIGRDDNGMITISVTFEDMERLEELWYQMVQVRDNWQSNKLQILKRAGTAYVFPYTLFLSFCRDTIWLSLRDRIVQDSYPHHQPAFKNF